MSQCGWRPSLRSARESFVLHVRQKNQNKRDKYSGHNRVPPQTLQKCQGSQTQVGRENLRLYERSWNQLGEGLNIDTPGIISFTRVAFQGVVLELTDFLGKFMR